MLETLKKYYYFGTKGFLKRNKFFRAKKKRVVSLIYN